MVRDRSSEEEDAVSPPAGWGRPGELGVGNRLVLACVCSLRELPFAGRCTKASTVPRLVDRNIGAASRAATLLDRLALVMAGWLVGPGG